MDLLQRVIVPVVFGSFLYACGGSGGGDSEPVVQPNANQGAGRGEQEVVMEQDTGGGEPDVVMEQDTGEATGFNDQLLAFQDSFLRFNYPSDWRLETDDLNLSGQIFATETTSQGGIPNCTILSVFEPGSSLAAGTEEVASLIFEPEPEPEVEYITLNGAPVSRITGILGLFNLELNVVQQTAYKDGYFHFIQCFEVTQEDRDFIFDSMEIL